MSPANLVTLTRLLVLAPLWLLALSGSGRLVGFGLILAGVTDVIDGRLARHLGQESLRGAHLDAIADAALLVSAAAWLELLHPELARDSGWLLASAGAIYAAYVVAGWLAFRRAVDPHQLSAKVAGGLLYAFALFTFLTGDYEVVLLRIVVVALAVASVEGLVVAIRAIHASGIASMQRSHIPHASNRDASNAIASASIATSAIPATKDMAP